MIQNFDPDFDRDSDFRRRPSLNKQLRKKLESMMTSSKVQFDDTTVERIRASAEFEPALYSQLTIKVCEISKIPKNRGGELRMVPLRLKASIFTSKTHGTINCHRISIWTILDENNRFY